MPYVQVARRRPRDPAFRDTILRIYEYRCAVCGYDALLGSTDLGIEAAPAIRELDYAPPEGRQRGITVEDVSGLVAALKDKGLV